MKGQWKTLESVLAGIVLLLFLAGITSTSFQAPSDAPVRGHGALQALLEKGTLRTYAPDMDYASIDAAAGQTGYLAGYNHSVSVCNATSCAGAVPDGDQVWASSMLISGDDSYVPTEVILYVFR
jgi:hypothetical protein